LKITFISFIISVVLFANLAQAQQKYSKKMIGRILTNISENEAINITNQTNESATISDAKGNFEIKVSVGDLLFFSAVNLKPEHYTVQKEDFEKDVFTIRMFLRTEELKEVLIEKSKLDAVSLGILSKPAKVFTPAERKLNEATTGGGFVPLNPILNYFSGRTAMLQKEIEIEKKEKSLFRTEYMIDEDYFTTILKIPSEYVRGFHYFCVEDSTFTNALKDKNKTLAKFLLVGLSQKYLALLHQK
jgi:hypothetical protein